MSVSWRNYRLWLLVIVVAALTRGVFFLQHLTSPIQAPDNNAVFMIYPGDTLGAVSERLEEAGIIASAFDLKVYARLHDRAGHIRAGEYALAESLTPITLLERFIRGDVIFHSLTIPEGWTFMRALDSIRAHPMIEAMLTGTTAEEVQAELGWEHHPEGMIFPDTYRFTRGTSDRELLEQARKLLEDVLQAEWQRRDAALPFASPYEALILASIVERETAIPAERAQIAGVFVRRLQQGMRLQTDPTVIYGLGELFDGNLTRANLRESTAYNTYVIDGLPPTPIALVGKAAIEAALHPEPGTALYFVARGDGSHVFSATLEEHNAAVRTYQLAPQIPDPIDPPTSSSNE